MLEQLILGLGEGILDAVCFRLGRSLSLWALVGACTPRSPAVHDDAAALPFVDSAPSARVEPTPTASASTASTDSGPDAAPVGRSCPDAGPPEVSPVVFSLVSVLVPWSPEQQRGTTFAVTFRGRVKELPPAAVVYTSCRVEATEDATRFTLRCAARKDPVCSVDLLEDSVVVECGRKRQTFDVPCGVRATLKIGPIRGTVAYH